MAAISVFLVYLCGVSQFEATVLLSGLHGNQKFKSAGTPWVASESARWSKCNESSSDFDVEGCERYVWPDKGSFGLAQVPNKTNYTCVRKVYLYKFGDIEKEFPSLVGCHVSTYAHVIDVAAQANPCMVSDPSLAGIVMVPPYLAEECNWPSYNFGNCHAKLNTFRPGKVCRKEVLDVVTQLQSRHSKKRVLIVDQNPFWVPYDFDHATYHREGLIFAKVNSLQQYYRKGIDISMPPPATPRCAKTPMDSLKKPVSSKKYFLSFKGQLHTPFRKSVRQLLHNGKDQVVAESSEGWDFDDLLYSSRFSLILRGDVEFSYRFNEVVCSGGIPVLVTDMWVPPFNELVPFESYGVLVQEDRVGELLPKLKSLNDTIVEQLRSKALKVCNELFSDTSKTVHALLQHLTS